MHEKKKTEKDRRKRIIIYAIILMLILLALLTSCSCTSLFFGKIGDGFFNQGDFSIDQNIDDLETRRNKELKFDKDYLTISLDDAKSKMGFSYKKIRPKKFTCTTSDASIATCYVVGKHVVINAKKKGFVDVVLQTTTNHKHYEATLRVHIKKRSRYIKLSSNRGTINLSEFNEKLVSYHLVGLSGKVKVQSSNSKLAKVTIHNGYFKILAYKTGKVTITVSIKYNGKVYNALYYLNIINEGSASRPRSFDNLLKDIWVSKGSLQPKFDPYRMRYDVYVDANTSKIDLRAFARSQYASITYNGKRVSSLKDYSLNYGDNTVVIRVRAENGEYRDYVVVIHRDYEQERPSKKDDNHYLKDIKVSAGTLSPTFSKEEGHYRVVVGDDTDKIDITGVLESNKASITYNGKKVSSLKDFPLNYGDNTVVIRVTAEDGSVKEYTVTIYRESKYTIKIERKYYQFEMYTDHLDYALVYQVYKNGVLTNDYDLSLIKASISEEFVSALSYEFPEKGVILLKPDVSKMNDLYGKEMNLTLSYRDTSSATTVVFDRREPYITPVSDHLSMSVATNDDGVLEGEVDAILHTNLFTGKVEVTRDDDGKELKICSLNQKDTCIIVATDSSNIETLEYTPSELGPTSLAIRVVGNQEGKATLSVKGLVAGQEFMTPKSISIDITRKYHLTLSAGEGQYNVTEKEFHFLLSESESIDLSEYGTPYKLDEKDPCKYYKFRGYSDRIDGEILYNLEDKKIISNLTDDTKLYALYEESPSIMTDDLKEHTLYLKDVPIFHNEEYYQMYHKDKIIYPGAKGYYIMNFKNEYVDSLTLTGITLLEDTICIPKKGCLNMGYILQHRPLQSNDIRYHYGAFDQYKILNHDVDPTSSIYQGKMIPFSSPITVKRGEEVPITLFWKWVEIDSTTDELDTLIGNQASLSQYDETINDKYHLSVALHFKENVTCSK